MNELTPKELAHAEQVCAKATKGSWEYAWARQEDRDLIRRLIARERERVVDSRLQEATEFIETSSTNILDELCEIMGVPDGENIIEFVKGKSTQEPSDAAKRGDPQYDEPWHLLYWENGSLTLEDKHGLPISDLKKLKRSELCVNYCAGISDDALRAKEIGK